MSADADVYVRTTVALREDLYQRLKRRGRGISESINEILAKELAPPQGRHSLFGSMRFDTLDDVRDHEDRV